MPWYNSLFMFFHNLSIISCRGLCCYFSLLTVQLKWANVYLLLLGFSLQRFYRFFGVIVVGCDYLVLKWVNVVLYLWSTVFVLYMRLGGLECGGTCNGTDEMLGCDWSRVRNCFGLWGIRVRLCLDIGILGPILRRAIAILQQLTSIRRRLHLLTFRKEHSLKIIRQPIIPLIPHLLLTMRPFPTNPITGLTNQITFQQ